MYQPYGTASDWRLMTSECMTKEKAALPGGKTAYLARLCIAIDLFSEAVSVKREVPFERQ